jgi:hypothetical protein
MTQYQIYFEKLEHNLTISEICKLITNNSNIELFKIINDQKIRINNKLVLNTKFIMHRINDIKSLDSIDLCFGVEIDLRDQSNFSERNIPDIQDQNNKLILSHDPFKTGDDFETYLEKYSLKNEFLNAIIILNIKSERIELECLKLLEKYNITNYFFLDSTFPMIYLLNKQYNNNNIACRFSEFEPIENYQSIKDMVKYIWVDCFTKLPLNKTNYNIFKNDNKKICIVSPELQNQQEKIEIYRNYLIENDLIPDYICCKDYNIIRWI